MEYISREELLKSLTQECKDCEHDDAYWCEQCDFAIAMLYARYAPKADVQPVNKWVSTKDRLPDKLCECLGVVDGEVTEVSYRRKQKEYMCVWSMCDADGFKPLPDDAVTHWMPMPEPPTND